MQQVVAAMQPLALAPRDQLSESDTVAANRRINPTGVITRRVAASRWTM